MRAQIDVSLRRDRWRPAPVLSSLAARDREFTRSIVSLRRIGRMLLAGSALPPPAAPPPAAVQWQTPLPVARFPSAPRRRPPPTGKLVRASPVR